MNSILLNEMYDKWICENLMYEPTTGGYTYNYVEGYGSYYEVCRGNKIKDSGKGGSERIYDMLEVIETINGIKL
jgi:hypothetical protein